MGRARSLKKLKRELSNSNISNTNSKEFKAFCKLALKTYCSSAFRFAKPITIFYGDSVDGPIMIDAMTIEHFWSHSQDISIGACMAIKELLNKHHAQMQTGLVYIVAMADHFGNYKGYLVGEP